MKKVILIGLGLTFSLIVAVALFRGTSVSADQSKTPTEAQNNQVQVQKNEIQNQTYAPGPVVSPDRADCGCDSWTPPK